MAVLVTRRRNPGIQNLIWIDAPEPAKGTERRGKETLS